jgi:2-amino-4-hydroxy-6-hydroxymethyldihydropteridine diphosphokinase
VSATVSVTLAPDGSGASVALPEWAIVSAKRRAHIERVTQLLATWGERLALPASECQTWIDAGRWHDAVRDADESQLRDWTGDAERPVGLLHGPAAALRLARDGEARRDVLEAIRWHTTGYAHWSRTGQALYMADFLEPGRAFARADRAYLAARVCDDFDATLRQVVRMRLEWALREGNALFPETIALWNAVR